MGTNLRIYDFFSDIVQIVPSIICPESRVKSSSNLPKLCGGSLEPTGDMVIAPLTQLVEASTNDDSHCYQLTAAEHILNLGGKLDRPDTEKNVKNCGRDIEIESLPTIDKGDYSYSCHCCKLNNLRVRLTFMCKGFHCIGCK